VSSVLVQHNEQENTL